MLDKINVKHLLNSRKYLVIAVTVVLLSVGMVFFAIIPQVQSAFKLATALQKERNTVAQLQRKNQELQQVPASQAFNQVSQVNQVLPSQKPLLEILTGVSGAVQRSGVSVINIELAPGSIASPSAAPSAAAKANPKETTRSGKEYQTLEIELKVMGTLADINRLLENVERMAPMSTITDITLGKEARAGRDQAGQLDATLTITSYYFTKSFSATLEAQLPDLTADEEKVLQEIANFTYPTEQERPAAIQGGGLRDLFGLEPGVGAN